MGGYNLSVSRKPVRQTPYILSPNRQKLKLLFENFFCNNPTSLESCFLLFLNQKEVLETFENIVFANKVILGMFFYKLKENV